MNIVALGLFLLGVFARLLRVVGPLIYGKVFGDTAHRVTIVRNNGNNKDEWIPVAWASKR